MNGIRLRQASSFVPCSRNYGGQDGATGSIGRMGLIRILGIRPTHLPAKCGLIAANRNGQSGTTNPSLTFTHIFHYNPWQNGHLDKSGWPTSR